VPLVVLRAWREADERATDGADVVLRDPVATRDVDPDGSKGALRFGEARQADGSVGRVLLLRVDQHELGGAEHAAVDLDIDPM
jgi:hypothetical protein